MATWKFLPGGTCSPARWEPPTVCVSCRCGQRAYYPAGYVEADGRFDFDCPACRVKARVVLEGWDLGECLTAAITGQLRRLAPQRGEVLILHTDRAHVSRTALDGVHALLATDYPGVRVIALAAGVHVDHLTADTLRRLEAAQSAHHNAACPANGRQAQ